MVYNAKQKVISASLGLGMIFGSYAFAPEARADYETEYRLGAMISLPFNIKGGNFFDWQNIRLGLVGQIAAVEETRRTFERDYDRTFDGTDPGNPGNLVSQTLTGTHQVSSSGRNFVVGGQLEIYFTPFADKIECGAAAGPIIGTREVQLAGLMGYNNKAGLFGDVGLMLPYSKVGLRIDARSYSPYAAATTLGAFEEEKIYLYNNVFNDTFTPVSPGIPN
jgi:hypothetical protein